MIDFLFFSCQNKLKFATFQKFLLLPPYNSVYLSGTLGVHVYVR